MPKHLSDPVLTDAQKDAFHRNMAGNMINMITEPSPFKPAHFVSPKTAEKTKATSEHPSPSINFAVGKPSPEEYAKSASAAKLVSASKPTSAAKEAASKSIGSRMKTQGLIDKYFMSTERQREKDMAFLGEHAPTTDPIGIKHARDQASMFLKQMQDASTANDFMAAGKNHA